MINQIDMHGSWVGLVWFVLCNELVPLKLFNAWFSKRTVGNYLFLYPLDDIANHINFSPFQLSTSSILLFSSKTLCNYFILISLKGACQFNTLDI